MKEYVSAAAEFWQQHKRKIGGAAITLVLLAVLAVGVRSMFRVDGVVTQVDGKAVTVADFFRSQTVDLNGAPVNTDKIKIGERIRIQKNLQGEVLYVATGDHKARDRHDEKSARPMSGERELPRGIGSRP